MSESIIYTVNTVVYAWIPDSETWEARGLEGTAELQIIRTTEGATIEDAEDTVSTNYRMEARVLETAELILRKNLSKHCLWKPLTENFIQLADPEEEESTIGLCFESKYQAALITIVISNIFEEFGEPPLAMISKVSTDFYQLITLFNDLKLLHIAPAIIKNTNVLTIKDLKNLSNDEFDKCEVGDSEREAIRNALNNSSSVTNNQTQDNVESEGEQQNNENDAALRRPPSPKRKLQLQRWFDSSIKRSPQFGQEASNVKPSVKLDRYDAEIPAVLVMLKEFLISNEGLETEGIFRLAPDKAECDAVKASIDSGEFFTPPNTSTTTNSSSSSVLTDVNVVATLIKVWFRELDHSVFDTLSSEQVLEIKRKSQNPNAMMQHLALCINNVFTSSLVFWLLDLLADIATSESLNKMSANNLAIVFAPNLYRGESEATAPLSPMSAMSKSQGMVNFTSALIKARIKLNKTK